MTVKKLGIKMDNLNIWIVDNILYFIKQKNVIMSGREVKNFYWDYTHMIDKRGLYDIR